MPISKVDQTLLRSTLKLYQRTPSGLYWQNEPKNQSEKDDDYQQLVLQNPSPLSSEVDNDEVLIQATNDVDAVRAWLAQHQDSANTFQSYRREAERLLLWALITKNKKLNDLRSDDFVDYRYFLTNPKPANFWLMPKGARYPRAHPNWRPFSTSLSSSSIQQSFTILNGLLNWLFTAQYLKQNPLELVRQRFRQPAQRNQKRYIPQHLWQKLLYTIQHLPKNTLKEQAVYYRARWLFSFLYSTGLRVSELCQHTMGDFYFEQDELGNKIWWLQVHGKGDIYRDVPITNELMDELTLYRQSKGLSAVPIPGEPVPLVLPLHPYTICFKENKPVKPLSRASLFNIIRSICQKCAKQLNELGPEYKQDVQILMQVSPHWIRHTAGTHMIENKVDILHVRDTLGHRSLSTTNRYLHTANRERHAHTQEKHRLQWSIIEEKKIQ